MRAPIEIAHELLNLQSEVRFVQKCSADGSRRGGSWVRQLAREASIYLDQGALDVPHRRRVLELMDGLAEALDRQLWQDSFDYARRIRGAPVEVRDREVA